MKFKPLPGLTEDDAASKPPTPIPDRPIDIVGDEQTKREMGQYEELFAPSYAYMPGAGGMSFGLQSWDRAGWGNPQFNTSDDKGRDSSSGWADARFYRNPYFRPLYDFTLGGGGFMPNDPTKKIGK